MYIIIRHRTVDIQMQSSVTTRVCSSGLNYCSPCDWLICVAQGLVTYSVRNSAQYALDCMIKHLESKNSPGGEPPIDPFTVKYFFLSNCKPPLTEKLDPPLSLNSPNTPPPLDPPLTLNINESQ